MEFLTDSLGLPPAKPAARTVSELRARAAALGLPPPPIRSGRIRRERETLRHLLDFA
jgi:hypothetical protein